MSYPVYPVNKGVNRPIEFKGLKAQYLIYLGIGLAGLLLAFAVLYLAGLPSYACIALVAIVGALLLHYTYKLSKQYGQYGLMKKRAANRMPKILASRARTTFLLEQQLKNQLP